MRMQGSKLSSRVARSRTERETCSWRKPGEKGTTFRQVLAGQGPRDRGALARREETESPDVAAYRADGVGEGHVGVGQLEVVASAVEGEGADDAGVDQEGDHHDDESLQSVQRQLLRLAA